MYFAILGHGSLRQNITINEEGLLRIIRSAHSINTVDFGSDTMNHNVRESWLDKNQFELCANRLRMTVF